MKKELQIVKKSMLALLWRLVEDAESRKCPEEMECGDQDQFYNYVNYDLRCLKTCINKICVPDNVLNVERQAEYEDGVKLVKEMIKRNIEWG